MITELCKRALLGYAILTAALVAVALIVTTAYAIANLLRGYL